MRAEVSTKMGAAARPLAQASWWVYGAAGLLVLISRLPWTSRVLYHWDSVNFALALGEFNLAKEQPQPPGYLLYVWLGRLVQLALPDPQSAMLAISIAASAAAVVALAWLGTLLFNRRVGWMAAAFLAASPLFWFYNEIALPHSLDAFLVIVSAGLLYGVMRGEQKYLLPAVVVLAVAGGVRQQTLVFLAPAALFALRKQNWRRLLAAAGLGALLCLAWFIPLIAASGGLAAYLQVTNDFTDRFMRTTSLLMGAGWWGLQRNLTKLALYTGYGWSVFALPAGIAALWRARRLRLDERAIFLALWLLPAVGYYLVIHMGQQGLVFVYLPALLLISAACLDGLLARQPRLRLACAAALVALSAGIFLFGPEYPLGEGRLRLLTAQTIANSDRYYLERFAAIRAQFPAQSTLIVAANWHHVQYYLPEYRTLPFTLGAKWEVEESAPVNPQAAEVRGSAAELGLLAGAPARVVLFDPPLAAFTQAPLSAAGSPGAPLAVLTLGPQQIFQLGADAFGVVGP